MKSYQVLRLVEVRRYLVFFSNTARRVATKY